MEKQNEDIPAGACRCECARCECGAHCYCLDNGCRIGKTVDNLDSTRRDDEKYKIAEKKIVAGGNKPLIKPTITYQET